METYHYFINSKESLDLLFLKFLLLGPPRLGKTTARRRLMGEIVDLQTADEAEKAQPSTGAVESGNVIVRSVSNTTAVVTQSEWSAVQSLEDEACMLFHNLVDSIDNKTVASPIASQPDDVNMHSEPDDVNMHSEPDGADSESDDGSTHSQSPMTVGENTSSQPTSTSDTQCGRAVTSRRAPVRSSQQDTSEVFAMFQEAMGSQHWKDVKHMFTAYLRVEDTGGQPELMDMLPALTIGPGLYLLFINLQSDLDHHYKLTYYNESGASTVPVESIYNVKEMLLSSLSSISCSNASPTMSGLEKEEAIIPDVSNILKSSKSVAYIVGTHKDKVSNARIKNLNEELQKIIKSTQFYDIVEFISQDELIVTMDNMDGGAEEVKKIQTLLEKSMKRRFKELRIPAVWLIFSLILRKKNKRTATLEECMRLSDSLRMTPYETEVTLWFLHHHAGVMMYFPNVPELKDLIIIDIQIVYDSVTILILRAMSFDEASHKDAEEFKKTGRFMLSRIIAVTSEVSGDYIPIHKLVALLEFLHILARIPQTPLQSSSSEEEVTYIMPCVLNSATREELDSISKKACVVCPIMIRFRCGFVPIGIFPSMIACLISNKLFFLIEEQIMKNVVQFRYGARYTLLTLICRSTYYEIIISKFAAAKVEPHVECAAIRKEIEITFKMIGTCVNYGSFTDYQFAFECPIHSGIGRDHLCVVDRTEDVPEVMLCLNTYKNPEIIELDNEHKVWFGQVSHIFCHHTSKLNCFYRVHRHPKIQLLWR